MGELTMVGLVIKCIPTLDRDIVFQQSRLASVKLKLKLRAYGFWYTATLVCILPILPILYLYY